MDNNGLLRLVCQDHDHFLSVEPYLAPLQTAKSHSET